MTPLFQRLFLRIDRRWLMVMVAVLAGAMAAWLSQRQIQSRLAELEDDARAPTIAVIVAAQDLPGGTVLDGEVLAVRELPVEWVSPHALLPEHAADIASSRLTHAISRGEPLLRAHIGAMPQPGFSARLKDGRRAVTIPVDELSSVSGLLQPGDLIDLYVSFDHQGSPVTLPLLQGMRVLATGRQVDAQLSDLPQPADRNFSTLTLDASLDDAVKLVAARREGMITAMLRRPGDRSVARAQSRGDLGRILGLADPAAPPAARSKRVPVIYGDRPLRSIPRLGAPVGDAPDEAVPTGEAGQEPLPPMLSPAAVAALRAIAGTQSLPPTVEAAVGPMAEPLPRPEAGTSPSSNDATLARQRGGRK